MDQEKAKRLLTEGAIIVFLNVPEGTEFGIDMKVWNTAENFRGIKMIPPGLHFLFYSSVSNTGDTAPRIGFFHNFKKSEFLVKKWDKRIEDISEDVVDENEIVGLKDNYVALDRFLGPYPFEILKRWTLLTSYITQSLLNRLQPESGKVRSAVELLPCSDADRPKGKKKTDSNVQDNNYINNPSSSSNSSSCSSDSSKNPKKSRFSCPSDLEDSLLPNLKPLPGMELRLTPFPERTFPKDSTPSEITKHSLDSSYTLDLMLSKYEEPNEIIGELQFCFVCFLVGHSFEAFEQWKKLVGLLCSCDDAIKRHRNIYDTLITILEAQLKEIPEEFLADIVSNNNFIYLKLKNLFRNVYESDVDGRLKTKIERFKQNLTDVHKWDFSNIEIEEDEDAPVVVET